MHPLCLFCLWLIGAHAQGDLSRDAALQKSVSLRLKIVSLTTLAKDLADQTGGELEGSPKLKDLKVTVFCTHRPASEIMERLCTLFAYRWEKIGDKYLLTCPREVAAEEDSYLDLIVRQHRESLESDIARWAEASKHPLPSFEKQQEAFGKKFTEMDSRRMSSEEMRKAMERMAPISSEDYELGYVFQQMDAGGRERFWAGEKIVATTARVPGVYRLPTANVEEEPRMAGQAQPVERWIEFHYEPRTGGLARSNTSFDGNGDGLGGEGGGSDVTEISSGSGSLGSHPFMKRWEAWRTPLTSASPVLARKISEAGRKSVAKSSYRSRALSLADHLEWLADAYDTPVIADAFRYAVTDEHFQPAATLRDWLAVWAKHGSNAEWPLYRLPWHIEGDWLLVRHSGFWYMKQREAPETLWSRLENREGQPGLEDYAAFAAALTPAQAANFDQHSLGRVEVSPLSECMPALRLWATLDAAQKDRALSKQGLRLTEMSAPQRQMFMDAAWDGLYLTFHSKYLKELVLGSPALGLFVYVGPQPNDPEPDNVMSFSFGTGPGEGTRFESKTPPGK